MADHSSIFSVRQPPDQAVGWIIDQLATLGLSARRTFDLQSARQSHPDCPCPHHGTEECDCQVVVLLVYAPEGRPATLVAHGNENQTWFSLVDTPAQRADTNLSGMIRNCCLQSGWMVSFVE